MTRTCLSGLRAFQGKGSLCPLQQSGAGLPAPLQGEAGDSSLAGALSPSRIPLQNSLIFDLKFRSKYSLWATSHRVVWVGVVAGGQGLPILTSALQHLVRSQTPADPGGTMLLRVPLQQSQAAAWPPSGGGDPHPSPPSTSAHVEAVGGRAAGWGPRGQLRTLEGTADSLMKSVSPGGKVALPGGLGGNWAL